MWVNGYNTLRVSGDLVVVIGPTMTTIRSSMGEMDGNEGLIQIDPEEIPALLTALEQARDFYADDGTGDAHEPA